MPFPITPAAFIGAVLFGSLTAFLAYRKNRNPYIWFSVGFLFGIFGTMAIFFASGNRKKEVPLSSQTELKPEPILAIFGPTDKFWYYLDVSNQQHGPMSHDALTVAWKEGKISPSNFVWNEELTDWKPLQELIRGQG